MRLMLVHVDMNRNEDGTWFVTAMYEAKGAIKVVSTAVTNQFPDCATAAREVGNIPIEIEVTISG